jgi:ABC-type Fe3+-siderophore transport system permease subunit
LKRKILLTFSPVAQFIQCFIFSELFVVKGNTGVQLEGPHVWIGESVIQNEWMEFKMFAAFDIMLLIINLSIPKYLMAISCNAP